MLFSNEGELPSCRSNAVFKVTSIKVPPGWGVLGVLMSFRTSQVFKHLTCAPSKYGLFHQAKDVLDWKIHWYFICA